MVCPFIDQNLRACSEVLQLDNVDQAMALCADDFTACPLFRRNFAQQGLTLSEKLRRQTQRLLFRPYKPRKQA